MRQISDSENKLSVLTIIPAYNEADKIGPVVKGVPRPPVDQVLVVDDGSTDATAHRATECGAVVISHAERQGIGRAIRTGLAYALTNNLDVVTVMAGNGKDDPAQIPRLLAPILNHGLDFVQGSRYLRGGYFNRMPLHRLLGTRLYPFLLRLTTGFPATDGTNGFRAYKTSILRDGRINLWQEWLGETGSEFYLAWKVIKLGYRVKEVPVSKVYPRGASYTQYTKTRPIVDWWQILKPMIYLTLGLRR